MFGRHDNSSDLYQMMKIVNEVRKKEKIYYKVFVQRYVDDNIYAFTRGNVLIVVTNTNKKIEAKINNHRFKIGDIYCNALLKEDCIIVNDNIDIIMNGEPKIYIKQ
jgi:alpha-amylase